MLRKMPTVKITPLAYVMLALSMIIVPIDWVLSWGVAILTHEICHIIAVVSCGGHVQSICITHSGAQIEADSLTPTGQIVSTLAGPAGGILLMLFTRWVPKVAFCAAIQSLFNLLPLSRLDGGRIIHGFLRLRLPDANVNYVCNRVDGITKIIICIFCLYFASVLSWGILAVVGCVVAIRRNRLNIPCKRVWKRVQ